MRLAAALLLFTLAVGALLRPTAATSSGTFLLEVPEMKLEVRENAAAAIPHSFVSQLELRVLRSSQEIPPGKIIVRINGEAANIIMSTRSVESVIVCDFDLYFRPGFLLHPGRNTIEASVESIYGRHSYAAFFLDVRDEPESLREVQRETTVKRQGEKPPLIHLISPQGPVENLSQLLLRGYVEGGVAPITVQVQHEAVRLSAGMPPSGGRGVQLKTDTAAYNFSTQVKISVTQESIEVMASDAHNNRSRWLIPVVHRIHTSGQRYAVVIGVSHYRDTRIQSLEFADRDAEAIRDFLLDPKGGGIAPANLLYLENENATFSNIRSALFEFLTRPGPDDLAIVYFAGHGAADPMREDNYYLLGYDTALDSIAGTALPMWDLQASFERTLQASVVTLVDACHSGAVGLTLTNISNQRWLTLGYGQNRAIITASDINEFSRESPQWGGGHGVFTYFLLKGLQGGADVSHNHQISVGPLFDFVKNHVVAETGGGQTPTALAGLARGLVLTQSTPRAAADRLGRDQSVSGGAAR